MKSKMNKDKAEPEPKKISGKVPMMGSYALIDRKTTLDSLMRMTSNDTGLFKSQEKRASVAEYGTLGRKFLDGFLERITEEVKPDMKSPSPQGSPSPRGSLVSSGSKGRKEFTRVKNSIANLLEHCKPSEVEIKSPKRFGRFPKLNGK